MMKYFVEARKSQHEKATEPKQNLVCTAKAIVCAENEEEAIKAGAAKLRKEYWGTGILLGEVVITKAVELPVDWNYGYGDDRKVGTCEEKCALNKECHK